MRLNDWGVGTAGAGLLSQFPTSPATPDEVMQANARFNLDRKLPIIKPCKAHEELLSVAAGGPSLEDTWQDLKGVVVAVNGSLRFLLDKGVKPWGVAVMDPGPQMKDIVPRVEGVNYFVASICDPALFDHLEGLNVGIWHPGGSPGLREILEEKRGKNWTLVAGGSTMGVRWLNLGYTLGFRKFEFHGLDSNYRDGQSHAYPDHTDGSDHLIIDGYETKLAFVRQVSDFFAIMDAFSERDVEPITIELHGNGWLQHRWKAFREMHPDAFRVKAATAEEEKIKYEKMWGVELYRKVSPGEQLVPVALQELGMVPGESVIDFGCGPARATQKFQDLGFTVLGLDIAENCRDEGIDIPFRLECLWDLSEDIEPSDWGFCCDVMEHIPPEHVDKVLENIRSKTKKGVLFNIAFFNDGFGNMIGERLHLTVRDCQWWVDRLKAYWPDVRIVESFKDALPRAVFRAR